MGKFMREFTSEASAKVFAANLGAKIVRFYDWDNFRGRMVTIYRVYWTVA